MVEDALGLKIYQYKIKKNPRENSENKWKYEGGAVMPRRENAHIWILKKSRKIERKRCKLDLSTLYREYLKKESIYLDNWKDNLGEERNKALQTNLKMRCR